MRGTRRLGVWGVLAVLLATAGLARADAFEDACEAARARRQPALVELATWCHDNKLFATRNELAREILAGDPECVVARRWLRHKLRAGGVWEEPEREPPASDRSTEALAQLPEVRARLLGGVARELLAALTEHAERVTPGRREALLQEILTIVPDDEEVRREHGEVRTPEGWRLAETVRGAERRKLLRDATRAAFETAGEPTEVAPPEAVRAAEVRWKGGCATADVRAFASLTASEARNIARACQVVPEVTRAALGIEVRLPAGLVVYATDARAAAGRIFATHPRANDETRRLWEKYSAYWIGRVPEVVVYAHDPSTRLESAASQVFTYLLASDYGGTLYDVPWVLQGIDRRVVWEITGTRLTYYRTETDYADADQPWATWGELDDAGWYRRARESLAAATPADLAEILGRPTNLVTIRDDVVMNAVSAYFVEARPECLDAILEAAAAGRGPSDILRDVAGLDIEALRLRLIRWLDERRP